MLGTGDQPIVKIGKKRRQRYYEEVECELTQLKFDHHQYWWSLGFEMEETQTRGKTHFKEAVSKMIKTCPETVFNLIHSHAYPSWLLEQVFASHLQDKSNFSSPS